MPITTNRNDPLPEPTVLQIAKRILASNSEITVERVRSGVSTWVYRIEAGGDRYYLRILPEAGTTFGAEVTAHQLARDLGAGVPDVLHYEPYNPDAGRSIMLTSEIPGKPLDASVTKDRTRDVMRAAGRDLARINAIAVSGFGWIRQAGPENVLLGECPDLPSLLAAAYRPHIEHLASDVLPRPEAEMLRATRERQTPARYGEPARLVHGDFDTTHIYWDGHRYRGIIDFGEIRGMPGMYDLGHHWMHDRERLPYSTMAWLLEGYREIVPLPEDADDQITCWSVLIAARALSRGIQRAPKSQIVQIARSALSRDLQLLAGHDPPGWRYNR